MEPAYTTIQPRNLYDAGGGFKLDYNPSVSSAIAQRFSGGSRPLQGLGALGALDVRPYVTFYTSAGAVPVAIDPTTAVSGNVLVPGLGAIPYDIDIITMRMILHLPMAGDYPVDLLGGGSGSLTVPGMGDIPYEVSIGPPALPAGAVVSGSSLLAVGATTALPLLLIGGLVLVLMMGRRR
jgi:hypothetical protein